MQNAFVFDYWVTGEGNDTRHTMRSLDPVFNGGLIFFAVRSFEEAKRVAVDAMADCLQLCFSRGECPPPPLPRTKPSQIVLQLPVDIYAKYLLRLEMHKQGIVPKKLAQMSGLPVSNVRYLISLRHTTKIETIAGLFALLGRQLTVTVGDIHGD